MNLSFHIAKRYLFSKKSHNAINIVSIISACGVCVGTMALVCVLSVFNGFGSLIKDLFSEFDPDLKISLFEGKSFSIDEKGVKAIKKMPEVIHFTEVLQENAMFRFKDKQAPGIIKGVNSEFEKMINTKKIIVNGRYQLTDNAFNYGIAGAGLASTLGVGAYFNDPVFIYAPKRNSTVNLANPENSFSLDKVFISGIFTVQQPDYDTKLLIIPIDLARDLFQYNSGYVTGLELKISDKADVESVKSKIQSTLGNRFKVQNRYEQQEDYFRIMKVEKWITYLILSFILLIAIFNIIGSLSMLIIDKSNDIKTLRNMGADQALIRRIFLFEGWLISMLGALVGIIIGTGICLLQQYFSIITLPDNSDYIIKAYPVELQFTDLALVFVTVTIMGFFAAYYPVKQIKTEEQKQL